MLTNMDNKSFGPIQHSWTQPYLPTSYNPFYQPSPEYVATEEMIRLDAIDNIVAEMTEYPDAEQLLAPIIFRK